MSSGKMLIMNCFLPEVLLLSDVHKILAENESVALFGLPRFGP